MNVLAYLGHALVSWGFGAPQQTHVSSVVCCVVTAVFDSHTTLSTTLDTSTQVTATLDVNTQVEAEVCDG